MSEPAIFVFVEGNQRRYYYDPWAASVLVRELAWGPDALQQWLTDDDELEDWTDEISGGAVVDLHRRTLVWYTDTDVMEIARVHSVIDRLIQAAWSGFQVHYATRGLADLALAAGETDIEDYERDVEDRPRMLVPDGLIAPDDDDEFGVELLDEEDPRGWITLITDSGMVLHHHVSQLPIDLIQGRSRILSTLEEIAGDETPPERLCREGIWFDTPHREIGLWGVRDTKRQLDELCRGWPDWDVRWVQDGYTGQCAVSGPAGESLTDAEALKMVTSVLLSTDRFNLQQFYRQIGQQVKTSAKRATGCVTVVFCMPLILFAMITGEWKRALITIAIVVLLITVLFKLTEFWIRSKLVKSQPDESGSDHAPVAGPIDPQQRRATLNRTLSKAGLPSLDDLP